MKKILFIMVVLCLLLTSCSPIYVTDKKIESRNVCIESHQVFSHYNYIGGSNGFSVVPSSGAVPVAQYRTVCDAYGDVEFYMLEFSDRMWYDVLKEDFDKYNVGDEYNCQ